MGSIIGTIVAFAIVFGILVFVHEFGHFFIAKLMGIRVEVFSWGYGKRLVGVKKGETDYRISLIPMGGYVKFTGEDFSEQDKADDPRSFMAKKRWQRFLVLFMGSAMNLFLAVALLAFINMVGVSEPAYQEKAPVIGYIEPGSPAAKADFKVDDRILGIEGKKMESWSDVEMMIQTKPDRTLQTKVKRNGKTLTVPLNTGSRTKYEMGYAGFFAKIKAQIQKVQPDSPAQKAGIKPGDMILAANGQPVYLYQLQEIIKNNPGKELQLRIQRGKEKLTLEVIPKKEKGNVKIGVVFSPHTEIKKYGFFSAFVQSVNRNIEITIMVFNFIEDLFTGEASTRQLGGPIAIANFSYTAFQMGFMAMVGWIAIISLNLGIINLFPIPVLDGGQIFVLMFEGLLRRDFSPKVKQIVMQIGFVIFIFLIVFVVLNDLVKMLPQGWESLIPW
ncbi:RIP metalloprotease RseP [bacterium]|nr:RIP metalloprotease RseP [bacterium]